jgi:predicted murein hydrolase (TIGR00659 family)
MHDLLESPSFGIVLTLVVWLAALGIRRILRTALANPVALSVVVIVAALLLSGVPYDSYNRGANAISFFLGPAVVAMAVPLYRRRDIVRRHALPLAASVLVGCVVGILSASLTARLLGAGTATVLSLAPKSVTTPIAIGIAETTGGVPSLTAAIVIVTGMLGAMVGPEFLRRIGIRGALAVGLAVGTAAHGIGTARAFEESELTGAMSSLGMILNGLATAVVLPYIVPYCL